MKHARRTFEELIVLETDDCILWPHAKTRGYGVIGNNGYVSHEVLERRVAPRPPGAMALHQPETCHNRACMNYRHLRWGTAQENADDRSRDGTNTCGARTGTSKLTDAQVMDIRHRYARGGGSQEALGREYGLTQGTVSLIVNGCRWKHLPVVSSQRGE